jgi:hypothetical protein
MGGVINGSSCYMVDNRTCTDIPKNSCCYLSGSLLTLDRGKMKHENRTPLFIFLGTLHRPAGHTSNTQKMKKTKEEKENTNKVCAFLSKNHQFEPYFIL